MDAGDGCAERWGVRSPLLAVLGALAVSAGLLLPGLAAPVVGDGVPAAGDDAAAAWNDAPVARHESPTPGEESAQARNAILRGQVVNPSGEPIDDVGVAVEVADGGTWMGITATPAGDREAFTELGSRRREFDTHTDEEGRFNRPDLIPRTRYKLVLDKEGYIPHERIVELHSGANEIGTVVLVTGDYERAREAYEEGYEAYGDNDFAGAAEHMQAVADAYGPEAGGTDPMLLISLEILGQSHLRTGNVAAAAAPFERLVAIAPDHAGAHIGLGNVRGAQGDLPAALEHFERAVGLVPDSSTARFNLGGLLVAMGRADEAVPHLERCLELEPGFPRAHRSLGDAHAALGNNAQAVEHLEAYLEQMPNAPDAAQVRELIARLGGGAGR